MRVLVACESSGVVRDAFIRRGHEAMSCDLLPTSAPGPHYVGDVRDVLDYPWDLMIAHPPCTHLSVSCSRLWDEKRMDGRQQSAGAFFMMLIRRAAHIPRWAIENPVGHMSSVYRKPDQIIQPYEFGEDASKKTCLWLHNLPLLKPTKRIAGRMVPNPSRPGEYVERWANQTDSGQNRLAPTEDRWQVRSRTYEGIAEAMAEQWGNLEMTEKEAVSIGGYRD